MKINLIIQVPDANEISKSQQAVSSNLTKLVNERVNDSKFASSYKGDIFLYLLMCENRKPSNIRELKDGIYIGFSEDLISSESGDIFYTIIRNAIKKHLEVSPSEKNCIIYFSPSKIDINALFKNVKESSDEKKELYIAVEPEFTLDEVIISSKERVAVMRAITLIRDKDLIYNKWNFKKVDKREKSILCFHGVPGTGKSMCAHGVASYLGKKIILGSYAQIESEFVGVGAKNLVALFKAAQEQDAVLFIDEADTFLSRRLPASNDSAKHYNSMSNELYTLIENFNGCIVFASNHIKDFDPAVISRIIEPIEFKLPDFDSRKAILSKMLQTEFPVTNNDSTDIISALAMATEGFSGRDLRKALQIAHAAVVWKYKYEKGIPEDEIEASIDDLLDCIKEVKTAKEKIQSKNTSRSANLLANFEETDRKNQRIIQLAALTLLADGVIDTKETELYKQLEKTLRVTCPLDKESIPSVKQICINVSDNSEKAELLDVVCRMSAIDGEIHETEILLLKEVCQYLDIDNQICESLISYSKSLAADYSTWRELVSSLGVSDSEILSKLKEEYNEGASYYRLSQYYRTGSPLFGGIKQNLDKAEKYEKHAAALGYHR
ncbi:MAG: AAA family ATPase [Muribaculaceae bacterium]|nr:AAA family ATPase [Muribaculaceae bacterium]